MDNTNRMPLGAKHRFESDFAKDIQLIMAGCNASTQPLFQAFVAKIGDRLQHLEALIPKCTKSITPAVDCGVDSAKLISGSQLIAAFDKTQGKIPKCKLRFEFYSEFIALISQSKHSENDKVRTVCDGVQCHVSIASNRLHADD